MIKNKKQSLSKIKTPPSEWSVEELIENIKIYNLSYLKSNFRKINIFQNIYIYIIQAKIKLMVKNSLKQKIQWIF